MRVLITGAAGFIGSSLVRRCLKDGLNVTGVDDLSNGHLEFLPKGAPALGSWDFIQSDFAAPQILNMVLDQQFDGVIHLAAVPRVSYSVEHPVYTNEVNVTKTLRLIEVCAGLDKKPNVQRFVFASSSSVYGGADVLPTHESAPKRPKSPYALQKSIVEDYLEFFHEHYVLDSACLRFFNVFGDRALGSSPYATALAAWLTAIKLGNPMRSDGDGSQSRDLCHVDNVTDACVRAAKHPGKLQARRFNVACGSMTTNKQILDYLLHRYPGATYVDAPWRPGDVMHTLADISQARETFGYVPTVTAWEGIERTCQWYNENWHWAKDLRLNV